MYQKDLILRMIEMIAELVAGLLGLIKKGDFDKAEKKLDNAYHDFLKEDASFFQSIPKVELTEQLLKQHNYTNDHLEILSELFYAEAELALAQGKRERSYEFYEKALVLLEFVIEETNAFSMEKMNKVEELKQKINNTKG